MQRLLIKPWQNILDAKIKFEKILRDESRKANSNSEYIQKAKFAHKELLKLIETLVSQLVLSITGKQGNPLTGRLILFIVDVGLKPADIFSGKYNVKEICDKIANKIEDHSNLNVKAYNTFTIDYSARKIGMSSSTIRNIKQAIINDKMDKAINHSIAFYRVVNADPKDAFCLKEFDVLLQTLLNLFARSCRLVDLCATEASKKKFHSSGEICIDNQLISGTNNPVSSKLGERIIIYADNTRLPSEIIYDPFSSS